MNLNTEVRILNPSVNQCGAARMGISDLQAVFFYHKVLCLSKGTWAISRFSSHFSPCFQRNDTVIKMTQQRGLSRKASEKHECSQQRKDRILGEKDFFLVSLRQSTTDTPLMFERGIRLGGNFPG